MSVKIRLLAVILLIGVCVCGCHGSIEQSPSQATPETMESALATEGSESCAPTQLPSQPEETEPVMDDIGATQSSKGEMSTEEPTEGLTERPEESTGEAAIDPTESLPEATEPTTEPTEEPTEDPTEEPTIAPTEESTEQTEDGKIRLPMIPG